MDFRVMEVQEGKLAIITRKLIPLQQPEGSQLNTTLKIQKLRAEVKQDDMFKSCHNARNVQLKLQCAVH